MDRKTFDSWNEFSAWLSGFQGTIDIKDLETFRGRNRIESGTVYGPGGGGFAGWTAVSWLDEFGRVRKCTVLVDIYSKARKTA